MSFSSNSQTSRIYGQESVRADHGRADWLGCWDEFVQKARFKKLVCLHHIKQNYLNQKARPFFNPKRFNYYLQWSSFFG